MISILFPSFLFGLEVALHWFCLLSCFKYTFMLLFHAIFVAYLSAVCVPKPQRCKFIFSSVTLPPLFLFFYLCVIIVLSYPINFFLYFNIPLLCPVTYKLLISCCELFLTTFWGGISFFPHNRKLVFVGIEVFITDYCHNSHCAAVDKHNILYLWYLNLNPLNNSVLNLEVSIQIGVEW